MINGFIIDELCYIISSIAFIMTPTVQGCFSHLEKVGYLVPFGDVDHLAQALRTVDILQGKLFGMWVDIQEIYHGGEGFNGCVLDHHLRCVLFCGAKELFPKDGASSCQKELMSRHPLNFLLLWLLLLFFDNENYVSGEL